MQNNNNSKVAFKLYFEKKEIRRLSIPCPASFFDFQQNLAKIYPHLFHPEMHIKYMDEEQELVRVATQIEWDEFLKYNKQNKVLKLYVSEDNRKQYFKDSEGPIAAHFYQKDPHQTETAPVSKSPFSSEAITSLLGSFFENGKILPYNMPDWLSPAIKIENLGKAEVNIDLDVPTLFNLVHKRALSLMSSSQQEAEGLFRKLLDISPSNPIVWYNLACCQSLNGHLQDACASLRKAVVEGGYSDLSHTLQDPDLEPIRKNCQLVFQDILSLMVTEKQAASFRKDDETFRREEEQKKREEEQKKREEEQKKLEEEQKKREEEQKKREEEQKKREEEQKKREEEQKRREEEQKKREEEQKKREEEEKKKELDFQNNKELKQLRLQYGSQLEMLNSMGFNQADDVILQILASFRGDVTRTAELLLGQ